MYYFDTCPCSVTQSCLTLCDPLDCSPPGSSVHRLSPGKNTGVGCHALLQGNLPYPGIEPWSPALKADSLPSEPPGKPTRKLTFENYFFSILRMSIRGLVLSHRENDSPKTVWPPKAHVLMIY